MIYGRGRKSIKKQDCRPGFSWTLKFQGKCINLSFLQCAFSNMPTIEWRWLFEWSWKGFPGFSSCALKCPRSQPQGVSAAFLIQTCYKYLFPSQSQTFPLGFPKIDILSPFSVKYILLPPKQKYLSLRSISAHTCPAPWLMKEKNNAELN